MLEFKLFMKRNTVVTYFIHKYKDIKFIIDL